MGALNAYQHSEALKAAIELDLFTAIDEGKNTPAALAAACKAAERGVRILCDYLVVDGFLTKADGRYGLAPDAAAFLSRKSPACMASLAKFLLAPELTDEFRQLTAAVRKGGTAKGDGTTAPEHPIWVEFARSMAPMMAMPAEMIARLLEAGQAPAWKVLDIAAGHGLYGIALAKHNPKADVTALDWPQVLEVARENAAAAGVGARHHLKPGSAFDVEYGTGYDLVLLTNFIHHFDAPTNVTLLKKVRAALAPKGRAVILEFVPNDDRVSPPFPAMFSLTMLGSTPAGEAFTYKEIDAMLKKAGFAKSTLHPLPPSPQTVVIGYNG
jgi:2-polyprenyl-3-methyl-5-hydroxy-6-metoxy-1,4-benzoquinol methylase